MRLCMFFLLLYLFSCTETTKPDNNPLNTTQSSTSFKVKSYLDSLLADTAKILKSGKDYIMITPSPNDKNYFGSGFSPYKIEPYDIALLEKVIDSAIKAQTKKGLFKNRSLADFKYVIFSVKTSAKKLQARIVSICNEDINRIGWNSAKLKKYIGNCGFSIIYDLTDKKIITINTGQIRLLI